eukprot:1157224-Pelagomonas_calceolata.AAC.21
MSKCSSIVLTTAACCEVCTHRSGLCAVPPGLQKRQPTYWHRALENTLVSLGVCAAKSILPTYLPKYI